MTVLVDVNDRAYSVDDASLASVESLILAAVHDGELFSNSTTLAPAPSRYWLPLRRRFE
jgi:hypothetical protein